MSGGEFAAIEARANAATLVSRFDASELIKCDIPTLLAAVRERDNTIARVRDIVESIHQSDDLDPDGYQVAGHLRAALDPQETP